MSGPNNGMLGSWNPAALPNLTDDLCEVKSPFDTRYNCIAFAAGDHTRWWWPNADDYWPEGVVRQLTVDAFVQAYETLGYFKCDNGQVEPGFEKIALFAKPSGWGPAGFEPTHAARQLPDGRWASKLGRFEDIEHVTLESVNSPAYGFAVIFMRRKETP